MIYAGARYLFASIAREGPVEGSNSYLVGCDIPISFKLEDNILHRLQHRNKIKRERDLNTYSPFRCFLFKLLNRIGLESTPQDIENDHLLFLARQSSATLLGEGKGGKIFKHHAVFERRDNWRAKTRDAMAADRRMTWWNQPGWNNLMLENSEGSSNSIKRKLLQDFEVMSCQRQGNELRWQYALTISRSFQFLNGRIMKDGLLWRERQLLVPFLFGLCHVEF